MLRPLGSGGMGEVYLGEQVSLGRKVAIKVLHQDLHAQAGMAERFKREARLLSAVEHPAVVHIVDFGESGDHACLVMEFVEGQSLYDVLIPGPMHPGRALPLLHQLAEGLAAIHDKGIIHRDLKPENVFISPGARGEQARLLDFGIARLVEPEAGSAVSQVGVVLGTPEYLSPEQAVGAKVDTRSDLYSFGVLMYRVLAGRLPFDGPAPRNFLAQHASHAPLPLDRAAPSLSRFIGLLSLVMRLLEKDPLKRPQSAHELADALAAAHSALSAFTPGLGTPVYVPQGGGPSSGTSVFGTGESAVVSAGPSGTAVFAGGAAPPQSSGTAAFGAGAGAYGTGPVGSGPMAPVAMRTGTAAFGTKPSGSVATVTGGASLVKPQNLTVMLTDIQGFAERTSRQTHEENARMLETHDRLLTPLVKEHEGRLVQKRGDALLAVFRSPTAGVLCGMAMQDRLWRHNQTVPPEEQFHVRVCLHAGEVLLTSDTVLGEPMEVVASVEHVAAAGEVTFTEAVNLARNRAEATAEPCGTITLPGREEQLQLYRCQRAAEGPPFGDRFVPASGMGAKLASLLGRVSGAFSPLGARVAALPGMARLSGASRRLTEWLRSALTVLRTNRRAQLVVLVGALALLGAGAAWLVHLNDPVVRAYALLEEGKKDDAQEQLEAVPEEAQKEPSWRRARAAVYHAKGTHKSEYFLLSKLDDEGRAQVEAPVLDGLAEDYGRGGGATMEALLDKFPKESVLGHFEDLAEEEYSLRQWGALRYLEYVKATASVDLVDAYSRALESEDCDIRAQAAVRLAGLGNPDALPALTRATQLPRTGVLNLSCGHNEAGAAIKKLSNKRD